jgi:hypothetical protein
MGMFEVDFPNKQPLIFVNWRVISGMNIKGFMSDQGQTHLPRISKIFPQAGISYEMLMPAVVFLT